MTSRTAIVVGGGIVGLTTAYALLLEAWEVIVIDPDEPMCRASTATAGIIGGSSVVPWAHESLLRQIPALALRRDGPLKFGFPPPRNLLSFFRKSACAGRSIRKSARGLAALSLRGWEAWQELLVDLPDARGLFRKQGCLLLYPEQADRDADATNNALRRELGMQLVALDADSVAAQLPCLKRPIAAATKVLTAGQVLDPLGLQVVLKAALADRGARFVKSRATSFRRSQGRVDAVAAGGTFECDQVVVAAGAGSARLAAALGCDVPMVSAHGASITFRGSDVGLAQPVLALKDGIAFTPSSDGLRVSGLLQVGGDPRERNNGLEKRLVRLTERYFGKVDFEELTGAAGPRPLTPDSLPVIGPVPGVSNAWFNFGHGHWGLTQAAISAQAVVDLIQDRRPKPDVAFYRADRFKIAHERT